MKEVTLIQMRDVVNTQGRALQEAVLPGLRDVTINESITRRRTDKAEARLDALELFTMMGFWARLRWVLTGDLPEAPAEVQSVYPSDPADKIAMAAEMDHPGLV